MRAIKRQRYAVVERKRLEKTLGIGESTEMAEETTTSIRNDVSQEQDCENNKSQSMETEIKRTRLGKSAQKKAKQRKTLKRLGIKKGQFKWTPQKH
jgi:hypothetical protein